MVVASPWKPSIPARLQPTACRANQQAVRPGRSSKIQSKALRVNANFANRFNVIWAVQPADRK